MPRKTMCLCAVEDIPDGGARGFGDGTSSSLFAIRRGREVYVYRNCCPHAGTPLNWMPNRFLTRDQSLIICTTHGALFDIESGECTLGPCVGERLTAIPMEITAGKVWIEYAGDC